MPKRNYEVTNLYAPELMDHLPDNMKKVIRKTIRVRDNLAKCKSDDRRRYGWLCHIHGVSLWKIRQMEANNELAEVTR